MADITFEIPDTPGAEIVVRPGIWRTRILKDGQPLPRASGRTGPYRLSLADGSERLLRVTGFINLSVEVDGQVYPLERRLRPFEYLLVGVPLILAVPPIGGGAVGAGLGVAGVFFNARLARMVAQQPLRVLSMIGLSVCLLGIYYAVVVVVAMLVHPGVLAFAVGDCYEGSTTPLRTDALRKVSCATAHDAEVIGMPAYSGATAAYPDQPALVAFANSICPDAFAAYVGQPFDVAAEGMVFLTPTADGWAAGDRTVVCLAVASPGERLRGSLKGRGPGSTSSIQGSRSPEPEATPTPRLTASPDMR